MDATRPDASEQRCGSIAALTQFGRHLIAASPGDAILFGVVMTLHQAPFARSLARGLSGALLGVATVSAQQSPPTPGQSGATELVYLDAAQDHTRTAEDQKQMAEIMKARPGPGAADLASAQAYQQFVRRQRGLEWPIGEIIAARTFDTEGRVRGPRASQRVTAATLAAIVPPDFAKIQSPVLSLYSDQGTAAEMLGFLRDDPAMLARATLFLSN